MRRNSFHIPSFSMIEMLVVLVLSSMIVGIVYSAYYTVSRYQLEITRKYVRYGDLSEVYFNLKRDFDRSQRVETVKGLNALRFKSSARPETVYYFSPDVVVRKQVERSDTFQCVAGKPVFLFEGKEVRSDKISLIDEVRMDINSLPDPAVLVLQKRYDAASRIELEEKDTIQ